ncbi:MAG: acetylornithine deacetylase [Sphingopyxis sp.]|uniref:acetylornithine deacetylase n=1 Tax=Sphingopyxis sp. TaxID=1908224 RepID=UPI002AB91A9E|nr:acetylornithine deacetylase [Sphingopyxis sp.]MDZ3832850.1 acetylornithine deacetylase [Sphingopyxis sp.]
MPEATSRRPSDTTVAMLGRLVAFPTVSRDSNLELIHWVRDYLAGHGIASRLSHNAEGNKANLFATIGTGDGGLLLSGHSDVVPVAGQAWATDPFALTERDGRLYGRGTCDMKGFVAAVLAKVPMLAARENGTPFHIALSFDEEVGCKGVGHLIADLIEQGVRPAGCIVGEPTDMNVIVGHKDGTAWRCSVEGREVHSSLAPHGVNAIEYAARMIVRIREIAERLEREEPRHPGYEIPFSTMQTGVIEGGQASNIVPRHCSFRFDMRTLPTTSSDALIAEIRDYAERELVPAMRRIAPDAAIRIEKLGRVPGFAIDPEAPLVRHVQRAALSNAAPGHVAFGSEAGLFQEAAIPTIICGPGSIAQAHQPDEYLTLDQLARCEDFIDRLAETPFIAG